jgi:hypothetical protein
MHITCKRRREEAESGERRRGEKTGEWRVKMFTIKSA